MLCARVERSVTVLRKIFAYEWREMAPATFCYADRLKAVSVCWKLVQADRN